jgi:hypothetical protein
VQIMTSKFSRKPRGDLRPELLAELEPYANMSSAAIVVLGLIGGWAGRSWPIILGVVCLQVTGNVILEKVTREWRSIAVLRNTVGVWNITAMGVTTLIAGGYPTPFWLSFLVGAVVAGVLVDERGILLNAAVAALALSAPRLWTRLDRATATGIGMQVLILLIAGLIAKKSSTELFHKQRQLHETEDTLRESNDLLESSVAQLEQHSREIGLLTGMGGMLQSCTTLEEVYDVTGSYMKELFPSESGALFMYSPSRNDLEAAITWGTFLQKVKPAFSQQMNAGHCGKGESTSETRTPRACPAGMSSIRRQPSTCVRR